MTRHTTYEIVVIAYRSREPLVAFLESLGDEVPVIIVDNSAEDDDLSGLVESYVNVRRVDAGGNVGFSAGADIGASSSDAEFLIFMNPDTVPSRQQLDRMVDTLSQHSHVASCGAVGIDTAGGGALPTIPRAIAHVVGLHRLFPTIGIYFYPQTEKPVAVEWVSGSCLAIRRSEYESIGGFDDSYFVFMSDFDLGRRLRDAGRTQLLLGNAIVAHHDGGSSDLPSEWTWSERGKGWAEYLKRTMPRWRGISIAAILVAGFVGRIVIYTIARRPIKAREMTAYARSLIEHWRTFTL